MVGISPLDYKEIKPVNPTGNQPRLFIGSLILKLRCFGHLMQRANSLEKTLMLGKIEGKKKRERQRIRWLDSITELNQHESEQTPGDSEGQRNLECCNPWGHRVRHDGESN